MVDIRFVFRIPYNALFGNIFIVGQSNKSKFKLIQIGVIKYCTSFKSQHCVFFRRDIWEANLDYINQHNDEFQRGEHSYTLGLNEFADLVTLNIKRPIYTFILLVMILSCK